MAEGGRQTSEIGRRNRQAKVASLLLIALRSLFPRVARSPENSSSQLKLARERSINSHLFAYFVGAESAQSFWKRGSRPHTWWRMSTLLKPMA